MCAWLIETASVEETEALGARLGALLRAGDVVLLQGELGAGKTAMARGIARGAGSPDLVNSPSFVIVNEYEAPARLYHADLYRLTSPDEIPALDLSGYTRDGILIVEWPERGEGLLPAEHVRVQIEDTGDDRRRMRFVPYGRRAEEIVAALRGLGVGVPHV